MKAADIKPNTLYHCGPKDFFLTADEPLVKVKAQRKYYQEPDDVKILTKVAVQRVTQSGWVSTYTEHVMPGALDIKADTTVAKLQAAEKRKRAATKRRFRDSQAAPRLVAQLDKLGYSDVKLPFGHHDQGFISVSVPELRKIIKVLKEAQS